MAVVPNPRQRCCTWLKFKNCSKTFRFQDTLIFGVLTSFSNPWTTFFCFESPRRPSKVVDNFVASVFHDVMRVSVATLLSDVEEPCDDRADFGLVTFRAHEVFVTDRLASISELYTVMVCHGNPSGLLLTEKCVFYVSYCGCCNNVFWYITAESVARRHRQYISTKKSEIFPPNWTLLINYISCGDV